MDTFILITLCLILLGGVIMSYSLVFTKRILDKVKNLKIKHIWKWLAGFMGLFIAGYLLTFIAVYAGKQDILPFLTGAIFFAGALFVALTVNTGYKTILEISELYELSQQSRELQLAKEEIEKINELLHEKNQDLNFKNQELEQFAFITSHDLQEPLNTVNTCARRLAKKHSEHLDEKGKNYIHFIQEATDRMGLLISALLDYSRIGRKKELAVIETKELLHEIISDVNELIDRNNAKVEVKRLPPIKGYKTEIRLLFQNLITNGIKFHSPNKAPLITIDAQENPEGVTFCVKDNGIGIHKEHHQKIFDIFQRLNGREEYEGTGIGLAHCKKITEMHDGKIWVESEENIGSKFYVFLPQ